MESCDPNGSPIMCIVKMMHIVKRNKEHVSYIAIGRVLSGTVKIKSVNSIDYQWTAQKGKLCDIGATFVQMGRYDYPDPEQVEQILFGIPCGSFCTVCFKTLNGEINCETAFELTINDEIECELEPSSGFYRLLNGYFRSSSLRDSLTNSRNSSISLSNNSAASLKRKKVKISFLPSIFYPGGRAKTLLKNPFAIGFFNVS